MQNKTILITGATNGIGYESALTLANMGATIVFGARNIEKAQNVKMQIIKETGNKNISFIIADFTSLKEVKKFADEFKKEFSKLDILINNVGAMSAKREITRDGFELCWGLNHLSYFLLTQELLSLLEKSGTESEKSRIINVASMAHKRATINFDDLHSEKDFRKWQAYGQSKLANIMFTYALARRLKNKNITTNCLHPGVVATGFILNIGFFEKLLSPIINRFLISAKKGAQTTIYLASSKEVKNISGKYFDKCKIKTSSILSNNEEEQEKLWEISKKQI